MDNNMSIRYGAGVLTAVLPEEIDHHTAESIRKELDSSAVRFCAKKMILDFSKVEFADSSAVGLVMGRYRLMDEMGGAVELVNLVGQCRRILQMSGIGELISIKEKNI